MLPITSHERFYNMNRVTVGLSLVAILAIGLIAMGGVNWGCQCIKGLNTTHSQIIVGAGVFSLLSVMILSCKKMMPSKRSVTFVNGFYELTKEEAQIVSQVLNEWQYLPYTCVRNGTKYEYLDYALMGKVESATVKIVNEYKQKSETYSIVSKEIVERVLNLPKEGDIPTFVSPQTLKDCGDVLRPEEQFKFIDSDSPSVRYCKRKKIEFTDGSPVGYYRSVCLNEPEGDELVRIEILKIRHEIKPPDKKP